MGETRKTKIRWLREDIYDTYVKGKIIDIGCGIFDTNDGADLIHPDAEAHDRHICDSTTMDAYPDNSFDCCWSSHNMEHLMDPLTAIANWLRICKPGGVVCIFVPHKELYEDKDTLPSRFNGDHRTMWLPDTYEPPNTFSVKHTVQDAIKRSGIKAEILWVKVCDENWVKPDINTHATGEYQIECVIKKL